MEMVGGGSKELKVSKVSQILGIINTIASFDTMRVVSKASKVANVSRWSALGDFSRAFGPRAAEGYRSGTKMPHKNP